MTTTRILPGALLALGLAAAAGPAAAQERQAPPAPGTPKAFRVPPARRFALPNGLRVTLVPYGTTPKATVLLTVRTGNGDEGPQETWLTDLTADLMQEGTTTRSAAQIADQAAAMGGSLSVSVGEDRTWAGGDVLGEFAPGMVELVADVVRNPRFPEPELPRLQAAIARQVAIARSQPQSLAGERFRQVLYPGHAYGRSFPSEAQLLGYTAAQVRAYHAAHFGAGRSHLYVAGRFDAAAVEEAVRRAFGTWGRGPAAADIRPEPASGRAVYLIDRPGAVQSTLFLGLPTVGPTHPDWVPLQVTDALLGGAFASRITANIREAKGYTYSPYSMVSQRLGSAFWLQQADVTTPVTGASLTEIFREIQRLQDEPPPAEELRGIQNYLAGTFVLRNSSRRGIINQLSFLDLHGLPEDYLETFVQKVYAVTPAEVQRIARTYLVEERMPIVVVGDRAAVEEQLRPFGEIRP
ncbi:MAG TPA: pitrilysin family protein [Longimicrobium sp.]|nr:pitrilysin family protein [Longimicrobium sp.]